MPDRLIERQEIEDRLGDFVDDYEETTKFVLELSDSYEEAFQLLVERNKELLENVEHREFLKKQMAELIDSHVGRLFICVFTEETFTPKMEEVIGNHGSS